MIVTDDMVQTAFDWMECNSGHVAAAAAEKRLAEGLVKITRSRLFLGYTGNVAERNAKAECHPDLLQAVEREARAIGEVEKNNHDRKRSIAVVDAWRTESANYRGMARVG